MTEQDLYNELALYTLQKRDPEFIHQYIVDAYAAQNADENTKPITLVFALAGLYLHIEKNFTGKEVQNAHMRMARARKDWPKLELVHERGSIRINNVFDVAPGSDRDEMIIKWSRSVWAAWVSRREEIIKLTSGII